MKYRTVAWVAGGILVALAVYLALRPQGAGTPGQQQATPRYIAAEGKVEARPGAEMQIGSEMTARIKRFLVNEGDQVTKGQVIAILSADELTARLRQAEAALQRALAERLNAEREFKRATQLHTDKFVSQAALDSAESASKVAAAKAAEAEADVRYIRSLLDKTRVLAPIGGTLIERYLDVGEVVMPEKPIAEIADTGQLRINAEVDETDAGRLKLGDPVQISAYAYPGKIYRGRVEEIASYVGKREIKPNNPAVNLGLKIIQVKIAFEEPNPLKLGMTVDVRIIPADRR